MRVFAGWGNDDGLGGITNINEILDRIGSSSPCKNRIFEEILVDFTNNDRMNDAKIKVENGRLEILFEVQDKHGDWHEVIVEGKVKYSFPPSMLKVRVEKAEAIGWLMNINIKSTLLEEMADIEDVKVSGDDILLEF